MTLQMPMWPDMVTWAEVGRRLLPLFWRIGFFPPKIGSHLE
jgi:hypothetical protein